MLYVRFIGTLVPCVSRSIYFCSFARMAAMASISDLIYPCPDPIPQKRDVPMQVLAVGLSRTGTESLCRALAILGYDHVYHGFDFLKQPEQVRPWIHLLERKISGGNFHATAADFDRIIGHCAAATDLPCSALAAELMAAYPSAKVIINERKNKKDWWESYARTVDPLVSDWRYAFKCHFDAEAYWARRLVCDVQTIHYGGNFQTHGIAGYEHHYSEMRRLAGNRALEWTVEDGW